MQHERPCDEAYPECPYCRGELLNHKPSRCLDAWVASASRVKTSWRGFGQEEHLTICSMNSFPTPEEALAEFTGKNTKCKDNATCFAVPEQYYSSDMSDAMALLKEITDRYQAKSILTIAPKYAILNFQFNPSQMDNCPSVEYECGGPDICMAICRTVIIASRSLY